MKKNIYYSMVLLALALFTGSCTSDKEAYDTSVTRNIRLYLDDSPWNIYYGTSNKPLFIYNDNGEYVANYSSLYNFALENGKYKLIATNQSDLITIPDRLDEMVIRQDTLAKQTFGISAPTEYSAGQDMEIHMHTRTGVLRLKSTDTKADKSYSTVRAIVTTPITGYRIGEASYVQNDAVPAVITRDKATSNGGINYEDDIVLLDTKTPQRKVSIRIDYLDDNGKVVKSRDFADQFEIGANDTTQISFALNNTKEPVIMNYSIALASRGWQEENIYPDAPVIIPDGYTYVSPGEDLNTVFTTLENDTGVKEIKLYLKAGEKYIFGSSTLSNCNKALSILGQKPGPGKSKAILSLGSISMTGDLSEIHFENLNFSAGDRFFNLRNQEFNIKNISFKNCEWDKWNGTLWYQITSEPKQQTVNTISMEGCKILNYTSGRSALWGLSTKQTAPVYHWIFKSNVFHGNFGTQSILKGLNKTDGSLSVDIEGNTIATTTPFTGTLFNIDGTSADRTALTIKNNKFGGVNSSGAVFSLSKYDTLNDSGNTRTQGYLVGSWGITTPEETSQSGSDFLRQFK